MLAQVSMRLTGFVHNAVSPVGMATPEMPIVLSHRIQALGVSDGAGFMWFGGGEPDLKLGMPVAAFVLAYSPFVCDCTYDGASEGSGRCGRGCVRRCTRLSGKMICYEMRGFVTIGRRAACARKVW